MKKVLAILASAFVLAGAPMSAHAACVTNSTYINGKTIVCTTCCYAGNCQTTCY